jgi:hypothetical protein
MSDVLGSGVEFRSTTLGRESQNLGGAEVRERSQERSSCWSTARSGIAEFPREGGKTGLHKPASRCCWLFYSSVRAGGARWREEVGWGWDEASCNDGGGFVRDREIASSDYEGGKGLCLVAWLESLKYFGGVFFAPFLHGLSLICPLAM